MSEEILENTIINNELEDGVSQIINDLDDDCVCQMLEMIAEVLEEINEKLEKEELECGVTIKTINGQCILGPGNIEITPEPPEPPETNTKVFFYGSDVTQSCTAELTNGTDTYYGVWAEVDGVYGLLIENIVSLGSYSYVVTDGTHTKSGDLLISAETIYKIKLTLNQFVSAFGYRAPSTGLQYSSSDGINWTQMQSIGSYQINGAVYADGRYVVVCSNGHMFYSDDLITWNSVNAPNNSELYDIAYHDGRYVVAAGSGYVYYSDDCVNWSSAKVGTNAIRGVAYGAGVWVCVGTSSQVYYSTDGAIWTKTQSTVFTSAAKVGVCYGNGMFVTCDSVKSYYSYDGIEWSVGDDSLGSTPNNINYANGVFLIPCKGRILYSFNGIEFSMSSIPPSIDINYYCAGYIGGMYFCLGSSKKAYSSNLTEWTAGDTFSGTLYCSVIN